MYCTALKTLQTSFQTVYYTNHDFKKASDWFQDNGTIIILHCIPSSFIKNNLKMSSKCCTILKISLNSIRSALSQQPNASPAIFFIL